MLAVVLYLPLVSMADEGSVVAPAAEMPAQAMPETSVMDASRDYVAEGFVGFAKGVDAFFGSDRNYQESNKSVLQFDLGRVFDKSGNNKITPTFRAKFHLPATQHRLQSWLHHVHLLLETNPDQNLAGSSAATGITAQQAKTSTFKEVSTPDSYGFALRVENRDDSPWRTSADGGLKLVGAEDVLNLNHTAIDPFARSRVSFTTFVGWMQLQLAESLFWFNSTGAGESTQFDADYRISDAWLFRSTSAATWLRDNPNFMLHQDFSFYQTLDERASLLYQLAANGVSRPQAQVSEYIALLLYRQRLHRDWMFLELSPQLHYPQADNYQLNALFIVRLEVLFSK